MVDAIKSVSVVALMAIALAGCQSSRMADMGEPAGPAPVPAAPAGSVSQTPLPPPSGPNSFPSAPKSNEVASLPPTDANAAAGPAVSAGGVAGVWNVSVGGQNCRIATPQTKFGAGYRAGPLKCPTPMDGVKSWNVSGKQLTLYDDGGSALATLYSSGSSRFDGQTTTGQQITLSR